MLGRGRISHPRDEIRDRLRGPVAVVDLEPESVGGEIGVHRRQRTSRPPGEQASGRAVAARRAAHEVVRARVAHIDGRCRARRRRHRRSLRGRPRPRPPGGDDDVRRSERRSSHSARSSVKETSRSSRAAHPRAPGEARAHVAPRSRRPAPARRSRTSPPAHPPGLRAETTARADRTARRRHARPRQRRPSPPAMPAMCCRRRSPPPRRSRRRCAAAGARRSWRTTARAGRETAADRARAARTRLRRRHRHRLALRALEHQLADAAAVGARRRLDGGQRRQPAVDAVADPRRRRPSASRTASCRPRARAPGAARLRSARCA